MNINKKAWQIIIGVICLGYVLLRFRGLTDSCLWFDEIFGAHAASLPWSQMFGFIAQDLIHPPLFYALLKLWTAAGGDSLFWLRSFPVFFSILALVPFLYLCRQLKIAYPAIAVALAFLAANGALIKYAQEVRMYSLAMFLSLVSLWLFTRYLQLGKNIWILSLVNVLLVYTHYFGWFVVCAEIIAILVLQRIKIGQILVMFGICLAAFVPWVFAVVHAGNSGADAAQNIGWIRRPDLTIVFQFLLDVIEPFYFQASSAEPASNYLVGILLLIAVAAAKILFLINYKTDEAIGKTELWMLAIFIETPLVLALVLSWILPFSIWGTRHLIVIFAPVAVLIGVFIDAVKPFFIKAILLSALGLIFILAFVFDANRPKPEFIWCAWEDLAAEVKGVEPVDVYAFEDLVAYHLWFALREKANVRVYKIENVRGVEEDAAYFLPRGFDGVKKIGERDVEGERFFIAYRAAEWDQLKAPLFNFIERGFRLGEPKTIEAGGEKAFLVEVRK